MVFVEVTMNLINSEFLNGVDLVATTTETNLMTERFRRFVSKDPLNCKLEIAFDNLSHKLTNEAILLPVLCAKRR
jgi:hypothetical protein